MPRWRSAPAAPAVAAPAPAGPALTVAPDALERALTCTPGIEGAARDPVLLVPAFSTAQESYGPLYLRDLPARGIPTCSITLDDHGFGDLQIASEYAVHAIRTIAARSGRRVAVLGHQHGALDLLWALRFWPDLAGRVSDYISLATPHRGTTSSQRSCAGTGGCPPSAWQIAAGSAFVGAVTRERAPAGPAYTSIATAFDVLVTPAPQASAMPGARNVVLQDVCPGRPVEHFSILTDALTHRLVLDALDHAGPAEPARLPAPCAGPLSAPGTDPAAAASLASFAAGFGARSASTSVPAEPQLRCYASGACPAAAPVRTPFRLTRRCLRGGRLRVTLTGGDEAVLRVAFKRSRQTIARDGSRPFLRALSRRAVRRAGSGRRLRAIVELRAGRAVLSRTLPRCGA